MACKHIINSPRHSYIGEGPPNCPYCEIERLRAALQWYADAGDYDKAVDCGRRAKEALGVNEQTTRREAIGKMVAEAQKLDLP